MSPLFPNIPTTLDLNGPELSFTTQPVGAAISVASGIATFVGIATATFPETQTERDTNTGTVTYHRHLNGHELSDGTTTTTETSTGKITYTTYKESTVKTYNHQKYLLVHRYLIGK